MNAPNLCRGITEDGKRIEGYYYKHPSYGDTLVSPYMDRFITFQKIKDGTLTRYTGVTLKGGQKVFSGTIAYDEVEHTYMDDRIFYICIWIKELARYAWLNRCEWEDYKLNGMNSLDRILLDTYSLEDSHKLHYRGEYLENPELLT